MTDLNKRVMLGAIDWFTTNLKGNRWEKGKGYRKYFYTILEVANITGRSVGTIRKDIYKGKLNMSDLISVSDYIHKYRAWQTK